MYTLIKTPSGSYSIKDENGKSESYNLEKVINVLGEDKAKKLLEKYHGKDPQGYLNNELERMSGLIDDVDEDNDLFVEKEIVGSCVIKIFYDQGSVHPRNDIDNEGKLSFFTSYGRGLVGNEMPDELSIIDLEKEYGDMTPEGIETYLREEAYANSSITIEWLALSEHGDINLAKTSKLSNADGLIVIENKDYTAEEIKSMLEAEYDTLKKYLEGDMYRFEVWHDLERIDTCAGYFGKESALDDARDIAKNAENLKK